VTLFTVSAFLNSSVLFVYTEREKMQLDPSYQRMSDVWTLEKRQLLVDSVLNGYDIPKIYFHKFSKPKKIGGVVYEYAIIDGKQRLESLWGFIDGRFALGEDFEYLRDPSISAAGLNYNELGQRFPHLKIRFDSSSLSIVMVETDDEELIEDMFSRLNEAVPLSAAEKRNAFGGAIPAQIRAVANENFFTQNLPFTNGRYRHYDLAAKMLYIEDEGGIVDTKKVYLDRFVRVWKGKSKKAAENLRGEVVRVLDHMKKIFVKNDPLLRSVGMIILYYHVVRISLAEGWSSSVSRQSFLKFEEQRKINRVVAESDIGGADYDLLEFDMYVQTPNDAYATRIRLKVILDKMFDRDLLDTQGE
jgi:Protein of unknown function DUF262